VVDGYQQVPHINRLHGVDVLRTILGATRPSLGGTEGDMKLTVLLLFGNWSVQDHPVQV
jgi:hypothetical protein